MGRQIYLSDKEIQSLIDTCSEWASIMGDGEYTIDCVKERMYNGLGSALYKLNKDRVTEHIYKKYIK